MIYKPKKYKRKKNKSLRDKIQNTFRIIIMNNGIIHQFYNPYIKKIK